MGIPTPEPGLVLNYAYLWHREFQSGLEEGRKNRPSVIVLTVQSKTDDATRVILLPITHSLPLNPGDAVEIPPRVKAHLGLDDLRSWVVVTEGNEFVWPGYDLRKVPGRDDYAFGFLPPRFFAQIVEAFAAHHRVGQSKTSPRS